MFAAGDFAKQVRLLLVDPVVVEHETLASHLRSMRAPRFDVTRAGTLDRAVAILESEPYDLILLDLAVRGSGHEAMVERLVAMHPDTPLVVVTSFEDDQLALEALHAGAEDFIVRGDRSSLGRTLRYAMERHHSRRELAMLTRELKLANATLEKLNVLDPTTECLNRRGLQQALATEIRPLLEEGASVLVLLLNVDDFRKINERLGHAVGDVALIEIAQKIRSVVRGVDYVARVSGDEFVLLLPKAHPAEVVRIAERLRLAVGSMMMHSGEESLAVTASLAAMMLRPDMLAVEDVLGKLHMILRRSKLAGKNRVSYEGAEFDDTAERLYKQTDMITRLGRGENLFIARQPIIDIERDEIIGYEFLSRFGNPVEETPDNFFRIAAERNALTLVDHHCLRAAFRASAKLEGDLCRHVNVYPSTLLSIPSDQLIEALPSNVNPSSICLEISEAQIIGDPSYLLECVRDLRRAGVQIAIDDVGFGTSCLESLVLLEPDVIKLDKRCARRLADSSDKRRQLRRFVSVASNLAEKVVIEGIERREDLEAAVDAGVRFAQGFFWGTPRVTLASDDHALAS
jgi:diguanylate cyclase